MSEAGLPPHTRAAIESLGGIVIMGETDQECEGARYHSPRPLMVNSIRLTSASWFPTAPRPVWLDAPTAWLCGTCEANISLLLQMLYASQGEVSWSVRREFGNALRALAMKGWTWYVDHPDRPADPAPTATKV